jgi:DNA-binding transcriptional MerR regulator
LLAQEELKQRYLSGRERGDHGGLAKADEALQGILASSGYLSRPAELLDGQGYGLPQASEWQRLQRESSQRQAHLNQLSDELDQQVRELLSAERRRELEAIEANLTQIGGQLRAQHKAAGGLRLP